MSADRLFPHDAQVRAIAKRLHETVAPLPLICPHGHVDANLLRANEPFRNPTELLISPDHYVTRLLHANGVPLESLGVGVGVELDDDEARTAWRLLCKHFAVFRGTPVKYWLEVQLADVFGIQEDVSTSTADAIFDELTALLRQADFRPRALFSRFNIDVLATTNDPADDLSDHAALHQDTTFDHVVIPTFRPDRYLSVEHEGWNQAVDELAERLDTPADTYSGFITAMEERRTYFRVNGATSTDHSHADVQMLRLDGTTAADLFRRARNGTASPSERVTLRRHLLFEMARMSSEDGLVMALHPGIYRNHHTPTWRTFGPDTGHDIPIAVEFTRSLQEVLEHFGTDSNFQMVLFTTDETTFSREIAPLAGFYPSVYIGAPWWFLDAPDSMLRARRAVTEIAGFSKLAGFVDDTRAFCSIPARHDMARRVDCIHLAELVSTGRLHEDHALELVRTLSSESPRRAFRLTEH